MKKIVVAIDGHSSTGKSTVAKALARQLGYTYVDSGAMYRCVTLYGLQQGYVQGGQVDTQALIASLSRLQIDFVWEEGQQHSLLNGVDVEQQIRGLEVSQNVSPVATIGPVRAHLVALQQAMGQQKGIVMDGRDIGTVVFPEAELKVFMTASAQVRAQRRYDELLAKGEEVAYDDILTNVLERDHIDQNRKESPLRPAHDALMLDNSELSREQQLDWFMQRIAERAV